MMTYSKFNKPKDITMKVQDLSRELIGLMSFMALAISGSAQTIKEFKGFYSLDDVTSYLDGQTFYQGKNVSYTFHNSDVRVGLGYVTYIDDFQEINWELTGWGEVASHHNVLCLTGRTEIQTPNGMRRYYMEMTVHPLKDYMTVHTRIDYIQGRTQPKNGEFRLSDNADRYRYADPDTDVSKWPKGTWEKSWCRKDNTLLFLRPKEHKKEEYTIYSIKDDVIKEVGDVYMNSPLRDDELPNRPINVIGLHDRDNRGSWTYSFATRQLVHEFLERVNDGSKYKQPTYIKGEPYVTRYTYYRILSSEERDNAEETYRNVLLKELHTKESKLNDVKRSLDEAKEATAKIVQTLLEREEKTAMATSPFLKSLSQMAEVVKSDTKLFDYKIQCFPNSVKVKVFANKRTEQFCKSFWEEVASQSTKALVGNQRYGENWDLEKNEGSYSWEGRGEQIEREEISYKLKQNGGNNIYISNMLDSISSNGIQQVKDFVSCAFDSLDLGDYQIMPIYPISCAKYNSLVGSLGIRVNLNNSWQTLCDSKTVYIPFLDEKLLSVLYEVTFNGPQISTSKFPSKKEILNSTKAYKVEYKKLKSERSNHEEFKLYEKGQNCQFGDRMVSENLHTMNFNGMLGRATKAGHSEIANSLQAALLEIQALEKGKEEAEKDLNDYKKRIEKEFPLSYEQKARNNHWK